VDLMSQTGCCDLCLAQELALSKKILALHERMLTITDRIYMVVIIVQSLCIALVPSPYVLPSVILTLVLLKLLRKKFVDPLEREALRLEAEQAGLAVRSVLGMP
jgi:hypothetical protein